ncbi:oligosaccharide translocation protein RFT1 [Rhizodiscina lignyota]|uniref:Man(5)GlcNAc(2)-PP-dolichol translocation protein RFT1 n=1 Tax=Rhizodiscina lignyota TaxID=1504668 RepID=A0A9P4INQ7_9PEZI|nr:oligosaccharide translocation protein RFT1 [Rhizodiscina lignyota]
MADAEKSLSASAAAGASYLILLQLLSRALTFALNQILLRFLSPELLGISAQLELYSISVLYFSRESIRVAVQRQAQGVQTVVNLSYLAILAGVPLSYFLGWLYLRADVPRVPFFVESLVIYGVACVIELLSEPAFVAAQQKLLYKIRASAETAATISRCLITCGTAIWASKSGRDVSVLPFAMGQISYAVVLLLVYTLHVQSSIRTESFSLLPSKLQSKPTEQQPYLSLLSRPLTQLSISLTLQSSLKYILTQADALLITALASLADQGAYALASNYGGLVARMVFQPIEESSRNLFAKLCTQVTEPEQSIANVAKSDKPNESTKKENPNIRQASRILTTILHLYLIVSLLALSLGPHIAPLLLRLIAGSRWTTTSAPSVLATYTYYIPLLALNGVIEAFVSAVATNADLYAQGLFMGFFSVAFAGAAYLFVRVWELGGSGLVWANCVNMALRIVWGSWFIGKWFRTNGEGFDFLATLPNAMSAAAAVAAEAALRSPVGPAASEGFVGQLLRAGAIAAGLGVSILFFERNFFIQSYSMLRPKR